MSSLFLYLTSEMTKLVIHQLFILIHPFSTLHLSILTLILTHPSSSLYICPSILTLHPHLFILIPPSLSSICNLHPHLTTLIPPSSLCRCSRIKQARASYGGTMKRLQPEIVRSSYFLHLH